MQFKDTFLKKQGFLSDFQCNVVKISIYAGKKF